MVLGGSIAIPAAVAFFGVAGAMQVAQSGSFNIGFVSMPIVFQVSSMRTFPGGIQAMRGRPSFSPSTRIPAPMISAHMQPLPKPQRPLTL